MSLHSNLLFDYKYYKYYKFFKKFAHQNILHSNTIYKKILKIIYKYILNTIKLRFIKRESIL